MSIRRGKGRSPLLKRPVEIREAAAPPASGSKPRAEAPGVVGPSPEMHKSGVLSTDVLSTQIVIAELHAEKTREADVNHQYESPPVIHRSAPVEVLPAKTRPIGSGLLIGRKRREEEKSRTSGTAFAPSVAAIQPPPKSYWTATGLATGVLALWLFGPTLRSLVHVWNTEQDYSHGYLVAPFAGLMLWIRRASLPAASTGTGWGGISLCLAGLALRYGGERLFLMPLSGWGLVLWLAGACWLLAGSRVLAWAWPALGFLLFMIPLPFRVEQLMSWHLQTLTTQLSAFLFECLGQSAIAEGHTVFMGEHVLEIEQACSGLRMFMGIGAIAFACVVLQRRSRFENLILIGAIAPMAMLSNAIRVVATGFLMPKFSGEAIGARLSHDGAGWLMIVVAVVLFGLLIAYLRKLFVAVEVDTGRQLRQRPAGV